MLQIHLLCVGRLKEAYLQAACAEYQKRLGGIYRVGITEIPEGRLPAEPSPAAIRSCLEHEGLALLRQIPARALRIALCVEGEAMDSPRFAKILQAAGQEHPAVALLIGGSHGLSQQAKEAADLRLSMSAMTFPHQLARLVLLEQLYRAGMINQGRTYHK